MEEITVELWLQRFEEGAKWMYDILLEKFSVADTSTLRLSLPDVPEHERAPRGPRQPRMYRMKHRNTRDVAMKMSDHPLF